MPEISRFFGMVIAMYFDDHPPPHFHVVHGDERAQVGIDPPGLLNGTLSPRALALVVEWAAIRTAGKLGPREGQAAGDEGRASQVMRL